MKRTTIKAVYLRTIDWFENKVMDWNSAGTQYHENGESNQLQKYTFGFVCDASISSENGKYVLIYQKLGTKGLLLKDGELLREINRSFYQSSVYESPAAFFTYNSKTYLVHCPNSYKQLDFEEVETGEIITSIAERDPKDFFHSRLEVSEDNKYLLSKGWVWHPFDEIRLFEIEKCFAEPQLLDEGRLIPNCTAEICSASFIDNNRVVVCASEEEPFDDENEEPIPPTHIAIWNIETDEVSKAAKIKGEFGNLFAIDETKVWDMYKYPKIIDIKSGEIIDSLEEIDSGKQSSSIIHHLKDLPQIAFNRQTKQIAIGRENVIEILSV